MRCGRLFYFCFPSFVLAVLLALALPARNGLTQVSSQSSDKKLPNSSVNLATWNELKTKFENELSALRQGLQIALNEAEASKTSLQQSTALLQTSLARTTALEDYNSQIAERMQERDEDLSSAYAELDKQDGTIGNLWKAVVIMGILIIGGVALLVLKLWLKIKIPFIG